MKRRRKKNEKKEEKNVLEYFITKGVLSDPARVLYGGNVEVKVFTFMQFLSSY